VTRGSKHGGDADWEVAQNPAASPHSGVLLYTGGWQGVRRGAGMGDTVAQGGWKPPLHCPQHHITSSRCRPSAAVQLHTLPAASQCIQSVSPSKLAMQPRWHTAMVPMLPCCC
jgi:hypothetical protein